MKKLSVLAAVIILVLAITPMAFADFVDVGMSLDRTWTLALDVKPDVVSDVSVIFGLDYAKRDSLVDSKGDMTSVGDYVIKEDSRGSTFVGLGYRLGIITPWVGVGVQDKQDVRTDVKLVDSMPKEVSSNLTESNKGLALGVNFDHWVGPVGLSGIVAKVPGGISLSARIKYRVLEIGAAHIGYFYNSALGGGIMAGIGVAY